MRLITFLWLVSLCFTCCGQSGKSQKDKDTSATESVLDMQLDKRDGVSQSDYEKGLMILSQVRDRRDQGDTMISSDYWNMTIALLKLKENPNLISRHFNKAAELDAVTICTYCEYMENNAQETQAEFLSQIPDVFNAFYPACKNAKGQSESFDINKYITDNNLDKDLVKLIHAVNANDKKYRFDKETDWSQQTPLDKRNQEIVDSLYSVYGKYVGRSLVGGRYASVMWAVVQHSDLKMMEKYLPIVHKAVRDRELPTSGPLKMLVDRVHWIKYKNQIFGSQVDVPMADEETRNAVRKKYNL